MAGLLDDAVAFAEAVLRADAAADLRQRVGRLAEVVGLAHAPFGGHAQPVGDVVMQRTVGLAERHAALRAARSLLLGLGVDEVGVDLVEVMRALVRATLLGHVALDCDKLEHALGHRPAAFPTPLLGTVSPLHPSREASNMMVQFMDFKTAKIARLLIAELGRTLDGPLCG